MRLIPLISKYKTPLALLTLLGALIAAPYMIAENPDSALFRSGSLGLLLVMGCFLPVRDGYARADKRTLFASMAAGFLFALALSVGSELFIYDGLLRGMGSMIRRLAVPVLATPLFGALIMRLAQTALARSKAPARPLPAWLFALVIFICWLPLLLAYYPGMMNYDFSRQFEQHTLGVYTNLHPLLHSALCNGVIALGEMLVSRTWGLLMMSLLQMTLFALSLGYSCAFAQRRGVPVLGLLILTALYALHPVFSVMALSMTKDTLFAAAVLVLSLLTWELLEDPDAFFAKKTRIALFTLCTTGTALLRNNGLFALLFLFPALLIAAGHMRKKAAALCGLALSATALTMVLLTAAYRPADMPSFQLYSLPAQQLVRAYNRGHLSEADKAEIRAWYTSDTGVELHPHLADAAKGYLDRERIEREGGDFLALWQRHGRTHAHEYIEAFLMLNVGSWYPDDLSHSTIYPDVSWNDKGYLQTQELEVEGIETRCYLPTLRDFTERICRRNAHQEYPLIAVLFAPATPFWLLMLALTLLIAKRRAHLLPALLGALGLWLSYLFGPCTLPRYALPLFCLAPVALLTLMTLPKKEVRP